MYIRTEALYRKGKRILDGDLMPHRNPIVSVESHGSYGCHIFDHLTDDGACFLGFGNKISVIGHNKKFLSGLFFESKFIFSALIFFVSIKALCERFLRSDVSMARNTRFISGKFWVKTDSRNRCNAVQIGFLDTKGDS